MRVTVAEFELKNLPPTVNNLYGRLRRSVYKKPAVRKWQAETIEYLSREWKPKPALTKEVELRIEFTAKDRRKWDIDNRIKPLQDCLERAGIIENDRQIESLHVKRRHGESERTKIEILESDNDEG